MKKYKITKRSGSLDPIEAEKIGPGCTLTIPKVTQTTLFEGLTLSEGIDALDTCTSVAEIVSTKKGKIIYVTEYMLESYDDGADEYTVDLGFVPARFLFLRENIV